ncbi:MAG TPA: beta-1,6-N-acetylglucosaminyltransferase [Mucilaginibacter sp.]
MKVACLIITYTSAQQTLRLIKKLNNGHFDFYIHVDKKLDLDTHKVLFDEPNVYFVTDRIDVKWGGFTSVYATINGLKQIAASKINYDYVNLLSGQDYPIKSATYIIEFLTRNKGKQFIHFKDFEEWTGAQKRIDEYYLQDLNFKGRFRLQQLINTIFKKRQVPDGIKPYGFATFWTLTLDCALYVLKTLETDHRFERFFKYTFGSDEFIYPTIIMNSAYKTSVINNNYRYTDWSKGGSSPKILVTGDFEKIIASDCLFGRKFDINIDSNILDMIDDYDLKHHN